MHQELDELVASIDALVEGVALACPAAGAVEEMNDVLSTGYALALVSDGELRRCERRIHALAGNETESAARERIALDAARRQATAEAMLLRAKLELLRAHFLRLRQAG